MKIKISKTIRHSLFIEEKDINQIFCFLRERYKKVSIVAICIDGAQLESDDVNEVLRFYNPSYRKIKTIRIEAFNEYDERISVIIGTNNYSSLLFSDTAEFTISSKLDENARDRATELTRMLLEMRPFYVYDWIARIPIFDTIIILWGSIGIISISLQLFGLSPKSKSNLSFIEAFNYLFLYLLLLYVITYPIDRFRKWLFPRVFFCLGNQKNEMGEIRRVRKIILEIFIFGVIVGIITHFITKLF